MKKKLSLLLCAALTATTWPAAARHKAVLPEQMPVQKLRQLGPPGQKREKRSLPML